MIVIEFSSLGYWVRVPTPPPPLVGDVKFHLYNYMYLLRSTNAKTRNSHKSNLKNICNIIQVYHSTSAKRFKC